MKRCVLALLALALCNLLFHGMAQAAPKPAASDAVRVAVLPFQPQDAPARPFLRERLDCPCENGGEGRFRPDVARALETGQLGGLGVDVAATEPIPPDSPLLRAPNCIITPHVAWVPKETRQRLLDFAVENLRCYLAGRPINVIGGPGKL